MGHYFELTLIIIIILVFALFVSYFITESFPANKSLSFEEFSAFGVLRFSYNTGELLFLKIFVQL